MIKRNRIITLVILVLGLILIVGVFPILLQNVRYYSFWYSGVGMVCLALEEFILMVALVLCVYFIIKPRKTLKGKKNLTKIELIFGGIIIYLSLIGIGFLLYGFPIWYTIGSLSYFIMELLIPLLLCFIPGIVIFIHRYFLQKKIQNEV